MSKTKVDFTTFGYLGLRHTKEELRSWDRLSAVPPFSDDVAPLVKALAEQMAVLQGCEAVALATSTLHLFWDLFDALSDEEIAIYHDDEAYVIAQWGIERATAKGVPGYSFPHHSPEALNSLLLQNESLKKRPIVVVDGISSITWTPAPLPEYLKSIEAFGGILVVDDTQAVGVFGHSSNPQTRFGLGGGGALRWHNLESPNIILVSSLAKGFGVPIAVLSGSMRMVEWFQLNSKTQEHCSRPCIPLLHAVENSLNVNESEGDKIRERLAKNVKHLQRVLFEAGVSILEHDFPVQIVKLPENIDIASVDSELREAGLRTLLYKNTESLPCVMMSITAAHKPEEIDFAANFLIKVCGRIAELR